MPFKPGDRVLHRSDRKPRKMEVVEHVMKKVPPTSRGQELANLGVVRDGTYCCAWIVGTRRCEGYFSEVELELQKEEAKDK